MTQIETLGILEEIEALVSDHLQVVSYKWLSRNFLVSSNVAKRLLNKFVEKHGDGLGVVYTLSGWLKGSPTSYHIRLVPGSKLTEAKEDFDGNCLVQVYSVQASIPKDPAALWNAEFVQAEELFEQPLTVDNCLRDNRFGGISNSSVKRNVEGTPVNIAAAEAKSVGIPGPSKDNFTHLNETESSAQQIKVEQSGFKVGLHSPVVVKDVKSETDGTVVHDQFRKPVDKEKVPPIPANRKKGQNDKSSSSTGGSLANLWGRASKPKPNSAPADNNNSVSTHSGSADAQTHSCGAVDVVGSDNDDAQDVNFRRVSNGEGSRKRRVVFDYSDEEYEDAVSLASPDAPKGQPSRNKKRSPKSLTSETPISLLNHEKESEPKVKEEKATNRESNQSIQQDSSIVSKNMNTKIFSSEEIQDCAPEVDVNKGTNAAPNSPKRRKVLKTRIDERGREVTEVVWEGEETDVKKVESDATTKKVDSDTMRKTDNQTSTNAVNRPSAAKKSPALGSTAPSNAGSKAGSKKAGNIKDPKQGKQGNIMSFFKRISAE